MGGTRVTDATAMETVYGFRQVDRGEKQRLVNGVFGRVAGRYDLMNDAMSFGLHRAWKNAMVTALGVRNSPGCEVLDVAGGTGDIAFRIVDRSRGRARATVLDTSGAMLEVGRRRAARRGLEASLAFVEANAEDLPFAGGTFDAVTIAFGMRNVPRIEAALGEAYRVLKRGGRFLCLEFSDMDVPGLAKAYDAWSFRAIPFLGRAIAGDAEPYGYLVESIRAFPNQRDFAAAVAAAGFGRVRWTNYTGGIAALHSGWKI